MQRKKELVIETEFFDDSLEGLPVPNAILLTQAPDTEKYISPEDLPPG